MKLTTILGLSSLLLTADLNLIAQDFPGNPGPSAGHLAFYHPRTLAPAEGGAGRPATAPAGET